MSIVDTLEVSKRYATHANTSSHYKPKTSEVIIMNNKTRKPLIDLVPRLEAICDEMESVRNELEQSKYGNLTEGLQYSELGERLGQFAEALTTAYEWIYNHRKAINEYMTQSNLDNLISAQQFLERARKSLDIILGDDLTSYWVTLARIYTDSALFYVKTVLNAFWCNTRG